MKHLTFSSLRTKTLIATLMIAGSFIVPSSTYAATTHHYVCSDTTTGGGGIAPSCSGNTYSFIGVEGSLQDYPPVFLIPRGTWYLTATYSGSGTAHIQFLSGTDNNLYPDYTFTSSISDAVIDTTGSPGDDNRIEIGDRNGGGSFTGTLTDICITDTPGDCAGGGGGGGGPGPISDYASSMGIVATNLQWDIGLSVLVSVSLVGLSIGWLKKQA